MDGYADPEDGTLKYSPHLKKPTNTVGLEALSFIVANATFLYVQYQACENGSTNYCIDREYIPALPFNIAMTLLSLITFLGLAWFYVKKSDPQRLGSFVLLLLNLSLLLLSFNEVKKQNFGGFYTFIFSLILGLVIGVVVIYHAFKFAKAKFQFSCRKVLIVIICFMMISALYCFVKLQKTIQCNPREGLS